MTMGAGSLGLYALGARPELRKQWPRSRDVVPGLASATGLYFLFQVGDRLARRVMPSGEEDIAGVYELRNSAPGPLIALLLAGDIGPSEELFWRGLVQEGLMRRFGRVRGAAATAVTYGLVHVVTGNLTLTAAAGVAGAYWGAEYALSPRLGPLLVSHVAWDIWIFLVAPTPTARTHRDRTRS